MDIKTILIFVVVLTLESVFVVATPTGPTLVNVTANETNSGLSSGVMVNVSGGRVATINITANSQNSHWKAFVGWVSGQYTLDDSSGSTIYDWSLSTISGEVYATRASGTADWANISCANATQIDVEDALMNNSGEDNISSTFSGTNSAPFIVAGTSIAATDCSATNTYVDNTTQSSTFEEVILYDATNADIIFSTIIEDMEDGFDENNYDFQTMVPENANETFSGSTAYYLYVELG